MPNFRYVGQYPGEGGCGFYCAVAILKASQAGSDGLHPNFHSMEMSREEVAEAMSRVGAEYSSRSGTGVNPHSVPIILRQIGLTTPFYECFPLTRATPLSVVMRINEVYRRRPNTPGIVVPYFHRLPSGELPPRGEREGHVVLVWLTEEGSRNYWVYNPQGPAESRGRYNHLWLTSQEVFGQHVALVGATQSLVHPYFPPSELAQLPGT